jgi:hypothetical protein
MRPIIAGILSAVLAVGGATMFAQQPSGAGVISGTAVGEAKPPYEQFRVQLRSITTGAVVSTQPLSPTATFSIPNVPYGTPHLVELVNIASNSIVCTEGPFLLNTALPSMLGVRISCNSSASYLLLAAAGLPAIVGDPRSADR